MTDVAAFQIVRSPRRAELTDDEKLNVDSEIGRNVIGIYGQDPRANDRVASLLSNFEQNHQSPLQFSTSERQPDSSAQQLFALLGDLDRWLAQREDKPTATAMGSEIQALEKAYIAANPGVVFVNALSAAMNELSDWLVYWVALNKSLEDVARGTRLLLVASLASVPHSKLVNLTPMQIWARLNLRPPLFDKGLEQLFRNARVELVREASVADLHVVRSEWRCYIPAEIAAIRNVMAGESFHSEQKELREQETTVSKETATITRTERTDEQTQQSDLSRQINTQIQAQISGFVRGEYAQGFSEYSHYSVNGGADGSLSIARAEQQASRISRQSVARAISAVETQTREARLQRTLTRTEDTTDYDLANHTSQNRRGMYRWVDRIDRYQVFRYPDRLQLEFELPQPSEYYRWRTRQADALANVGAPPAWDLNTSEIVDSNVIALSVKFRASNLPVLPDQKMSIVQVIQAAPGAQTLPNDGTAQWQAPSVLADLEIAVPAGYQATKVTYTGMATAARAVWHREQTGHLGDDDLEGFHSLFVNVLVGASNAGYLQNGRSPDALDQTNTIQQWGGSATNKVQFGEAMLNISADGAGTPSVVSLTPGATEKLKVGVHAVGVATVTVTFFVECTRSQEAYEVWQQGVYDALYAAWSEWNKQWAAAQARRALSQALPTGESSSVRNAQIVRDELKRQVITWLLNESPFFGRDAMGDSVGDDLWKDINILAAVTQAPTIQFLEQAFEWANMTFVFYPYYWADRQKWNELTALQISDPDFERFMKSGSARVIVPARPGMEQAVHHWLIYQQPFLGRPMPLPGDPMFVSIATEIRDLTLSPEGGVASDSWETRIGTPLVWLDDSQTLPKNPLARLGAPPNAPTEILCPT